jgi:hypothetical protein
MGGVRRNTISGVGLNRSCSLTGERNDSRMSCRQQSRSGLRNHRAAIRKERTLGAQRIDRRARRRHLNRVCHIPIRHAAVMFAIAAATCRQVRLGVLKQCGASQREAEQEHQQYSRDAPHRPMLPRLRLALQSHSGAAAVVFVNRLTLEFVPTAKSGLPSRLKSPTAMPTAL